MPETRSKLIEEAIELIRQAVVPTKEMIDCFPVAADDSFERWLFFVNDKIAGIRQAYYRDFRYTKTSPDRWR